MFKKPFGRFALLLIGLTGLASAILAPPEYDYVARRRNITYADVHSLADLRSAAVDRFVGKNIATWLHSILVASGAETPTEGAIIHHGAYFYTAFFTAAPVTAYRGLYSVSSERALLANAQTETRFAHDLQRCNIGFIEIIHATKEAETRLFAKRGYYRASDTAAYTAALAEDVRPHVIDLAAFMQTQSSLHGGDLYYRYGTHFNRLGADVAAVEISRRLSEMGVLPRPLAPGVFSSPPITNRVFGLPEYLGSVVDDDLTSMLWGAAERPQGSYPPVPDGLMDGIEINWDKSRFDILNPHALTDKTALVISDSFQFYLAPYFGRMFARTIILTSFDYDMVTVTENAPDIVIYNHISRALHFPRDYRGPMRSCPDRSPAIKNVLPVAPGSQKPRRSAGKRLAPSPWSY